MVTTSKAYAPESEPKRNGNALSTEEVRMKERCQKAELLEQEELRREGALVASAGRISKRTMAIAFGAAAIFLALFSISALGVWGIGILSLAGLLLIIWGILH